MLISFVCPGVGETRASPSFPASMFNSEDLPTLERPMKANSGNDSSGHESRSGALRSKMADVIFTMENQCATVAVNQPRRYHQFQSAGKNRRTKVGRGQRLGFLFQN